MEETRKDYLVEVYMESALSSMLLGQSQVDQKGFTRFLNHYAAHGYRVVTIEREIRRLFLFFQREAMVVVLEREVPLHTPVSSD